VGRNSAVLDVGCGYGELLLRMQNDGFTNLTGLDPFIQATIRYDCGVVVHKQSLSEHKGLYDVVMLNHAFEHMDEPLQTLKCMRDLLAVDGLLLIRIPVADSFAFQKYKENWVQLDAPRHFFLHTSRSMSLLAQQAGYIITRTLYDSSEFQFTGSESYVRNVALNEAGVVFTATELENFAAESRRLNAAHQGDQACFYLRKR
jgi:2-polyprenyl-3-methyl-5-hydroxy-6-metoxy-1,4-benzoquinol methylase